MRHIQILFVPVVLTFDLCQSNIIIKRLAVNIQYNYDTGNDTVKTLLVRTSAALDGGDGRSGRLVTGSGSGDRVVGRRGHGHRRHVDGIAALAFRVLAGHRGAGRGGYQQPHGHEHDLRSDYQYRGY